MSTVALPLPKQDGTANPPKALRPLFDELDQHGSDLSIRKLDLALRRLKLTPDDLSVAIRIDTGAYSRTLVKLTSEYEVLVMAWLPGQRSPIHDHRGSACAVRVVGGHGIEQRYRLDDDGLAIPTSSNMFPPGSVACSVDEDVHAFGNAAMSPASISDILVTVHVYAPPLAPTRKYSAKTDVR